MNQNSSKLPLLFFRVDFHTAYEKYNSEFEKATHMKRKVEEKKSVENLV